jgi:sec-independent protein translocase protein TatA
MNILALLPNLAGPDMIIIFVIVLIMFGAKKLPEFAKGLGQAVREFSKAKDNVNQEFHNASNAIENTLYHPPIEPQPLPASQAPVSLNKAAETAPSPSPSPSPSPVAPEPVSGAHPVAATGVVHAPVPAPVTPAPHAPEAIKPHA